MWTALACSLIWSLRARFEIRPTRGGVSERLVGRGQNSAQEKACLKPFGTFVVRVPWLNTTGGGGRMWVTFTPLNSACSPGSFQIYIKVNLKVGIQRCIWRESTAGWDRPQSAHSTLPTGFEGGPPSPPSLPAGVAGGRSGRPLPRPGRLLKTRRAGRGPPGAQRQQRRAGQPGSPTAALTGGKETLGRSPKTVIGDG